MLIILAIWGVLDLGYRLSLVTVPMLIALALAYLVEPLVQWVCRKTKAVSRQGMAVIIILGAALVVVVPVTFGVAFAAAQTVKLAGVLDQNVGLLRKAIATPPDPEAVRALPSKWQKIAEEIRELNARPADRGRRDGPVEGGAGVGSDDKPAVDGPVKNGDTPQRRNGGSEPSNLARAIDWAFSWVQNNAGAVSKEALGTGAGAVASVARGFTSLGFLIFQAFLTAFFFFFFCTGWGRVLEFWHGLIPERRKGRFFDLLSQMDKVIAGFVRGRLTVCAILMVLYTIGYWFIGVPAPYLLGPIVGMLALVPFAPFLGAPLAIIGMLLEPSTAAWQQSWTWTLLAPVGLWWFCQALDDYILNPTIQGKSTGMDTPTILFASIAGGALAGFYGMLVAIPFTACVKILLREVFWPRFRAWAEGRAKDALPIGEIEGSAGGAKKQT